MRNRYNSIIFTPWLQLFCFTRLFVTLNKNMDSTLDVIQRSLLLEICWKWDDVYTKSASKYCVYHTLIPICVTAFPCQSDFVCYFQTWLRHEYRQKKMWHHFLSVLLLYPFWYWLTSDTKGYGAAWRLWSLTWRKDKHCIHSFFSRIRSYPEIKG